MEKLSKSDVEWIWRMAKTPGFKLEDVEEALVDRACSHEIASSAAENTGLLSILFHYVLANDDFSCITSQDIVRLRTKEQLVS